MTGQAVGDPTCTDTDGGSIYTTQGTISGGTWKTTSAVYKDKTDSCDKKGYLNEYYCSSSTQGYYTQNVNCLKVVGSGYTCSSGACVAPADSDGDGVYDSSDVCPGYDDTEDWDGDGTPSGCETKILVGSKGYIFAFSTDPDTSIRENYLWSTEANTVSPSSSTGVTVSDGVVYGGADDIYALDVETGTQQWVFKDTNVISGQPTVADGIVYFGSSDKYLYAVDAGTGALKWSYNTGAAVYSSPVVVDNVVYVGGSNSYLYALNAADGTILWSKRFADYGKYVTSAVSTTSDPFVEDGVVYVSGNKYAGSSTYTYSVYALDADDGTLIWSYDVNTKGLDSPVVVDGHVVVAGDDGYIYAIDAASGVYEWKYSLTSNGKAIFHDGVMYIGSDDGKLYAFDPSTGSKKWEGYVGNSDYVRGTPAVSTD